jgi:hypothetical protein
LRSFPKADGGYGSRFTDPLKIATDGYAERSMAT